MTDAFLSVRNLTKHFDGVVAVDDVSFDVAAGSIVGIIGPNGSGKTTMINMITGVYVPDGGDILFEGRSIAGRKPFEIARTGIARTFQNIRLFDALSVLENVMVGADASRGGSYFPALLGTVAERRREDGARRDAVQLLASLGEDLAMRADMPAGNLPYADKRRLEIARALAMRPNLLLLDEPAAGMSPDEIRMLIREIQGLAGRGLTVVLVEHKMRLIEGVTDRVIVLDHGRKIADAAFDQVRRQKSVIEAYLGRSYADAQC
jgi:branched-chain amino acid transport system ATP-binding protein